MRLDRQISTLRRGIDRLIDGYSDGFIDKTEFVPRIAGLKRRMAQLQEQRQAAFEATNAECELSLVISRLEDFSAKVSQGLDRLDWHGMRQIINTVVRRIEIDRDIVQTATRVCDALLRDPTLSTSRAIVGSRKSSTRPSVACAAASSMLLVKFR